MDINGGTVAREKSKGKPTEPPSTYNKQAFRELRLREGKDLVKDATKSQKSEIFQE